MRMSLHSEGDGNIQAGEETAKKSRINEEEGSKVGGLKGGIHRLQCTGWRWRRGSEAPLSACSSHQSSGFQHLGKARPSLSPPDYSASLSPSVT